MGYVILGADWTESTCVASHKPEVTWCGVLKQEVIYQHYYLLLDDRYKGEGQRDPTRGAMDPVSNPQPGEESFLLLLIGRTNKFLKLQVKDQGEGEVAPKPMYAAVTRIAEQLAQFFKWYAGQLQVLPNTETRSREYLV
ncbi:unnamed protein product [Ilex paraguariensis]|uniref:Uncharacterized protein n=1 Tax=Ilex paraguariensis TaxID=185542 RepID=A0ABC8SZL9_9AQUA